MRSAVIVFFLYCLPLAAQNPVKTGVDYSQVLPAIHSFEVAIGEEIAKTYTNQLGLVQKPKGFYREHYGYSFAFLINPRRGSIQTPWGVMKNDSEMTPKQRDQRIEDLKEKLRLLLLTQGIEVSPLKRDESIAIVAFFEEINPEGNFNKTIILSVLKSDLDDLANNKARINEFKQRVKDIEY